MYLPILDDERLSLIVISFFSKGFVLTFGERNLNVQDTIVLYQEAFYQYILVNRN